MKNQVFWLCALVKVTVDACLAIGLDRFMFQVGRKHVKIKSPTRMDKTVGPELLKWRHQERSRSSGQDPIKSASTVRYSLMADSRGHQSCFYSVLIHKRIVLLPWQP